MAIGIDSHQLEKDGEVLNKKVTQQMFDSITREVVEETGIPASSLVSQKDLFLFVSLMNIRKLSDRSFVQLQSHPLFIGISRRELRMRDQLCFSSSGVVIIQMTFKNYTLVLKMGLSQHSSTLSLWLVPLIHKAYIRETKNNRLHVFTL